MQIFVTVLAVAAALVNGLQLQVFCTSKDEGIMCSGAFLSP